MLGSSLKTHTSCRALAGFPVPVLRQLHKFTGRLNGPVDAGGTRTKEHQPLRGWLSQSLRIVELGAAGLDGGAHARPRGAMFAAIGKLISSFLRFA